MPLSCISEGCKLDEAGSKKQIGQDPEVVGPVKLSAFKLQDKASQAPLAVMALQSGSLSLANVAYLILAPYGHKQTLEYQTS